jgi:hypothetical protein
MAMKSNPKGPKLPNPPKPPKRPKPGEKIELVEFNEPKIVCKCGPNEMCPICEE